MHDSTYITKAVAVDQPHPLAVYIKAALLIMLTLMQAMVEYFNAGVITLWLYR